MNTQYKPTYISLFSSAGVGCYGFKMAGFDCIATNELLERRLNIQRYNQKCKYPGGYICGDITQEQTKKLLYDQLELWKAKEHLSRVDVVIATPPCQGMSIANQKKTDTEIVRNSLVVESIKIIQKINPRFFVFENVPAFMKTICTDLDGTNKSIADAIERNLGQEYSYAARIINFKNYGACSSRQRTVVIGVSKGLCRQHFPAGTLPGSSAGAHPAGSHRRHEATQRIWRDRPHRYLPCVPHLPGTHARLDRGFKRGTVGV